MAYFDADAVRTRMRALLEDNAGNLRKIDEGRFEGGYWDGSDESQGRARTTGGTTRYDIPPFRVEKRQDFMLVSNRQNLQIFPSVVCEYTLPTPTDTDANRDDDLAVAEQDADVIQQAMQINMGSSDGTGILQGSFIYEGSEVEEYDATGRRLVVRHSFTAIAHVTI